MMYVEADILRRIVSYLRFHQNNPNSKAKLNSSPNNCRYINRDTIDALDIGGIHGEAELNEGEPYCRDIANISTKFFIVLACLHIISFYTLSSQSLACKSRSWRGCWHSISRPGELMRTSFPTLPTHCRKQQSSANDQTLLIQSSSFLHCIQYLSCPTRTRQ